MNTKPIVSVAMITYAHENFIGDAINGVFNQNTDFLIELIISNDCSPDNTDAVIKKLIKDPPPNVIVNYTRHEINRGMMGNFIWTLEKCEGKYTAICEGDDYWTDTKKLQKQVDFMENNQEFAICGHSAKILRNEIITDEIKPSSHYQIDLRSDQLVRDSFIVTLTALFRTEYLQNLPEQFKYVKNGDTFLFRFIGQFGHYKYMGEIVEPGIYRIHKGGVWSMADNKTRIFNAMTTSFYIGQYFDSVGQNEIANSNYKKMIIRGMMIFSFKNHDLWYVVRHKMKMILKKVIKF